LAEGVGTLLLVVAAAGSGEAFQRLAPGTPAFGSVANAIATAGALTGLVLALGAVSGGHFNPLITALQWLGRERNCRDTACYIMAQLVGAVVGAILTNELFGVITDAISITSPGHASVRNAVSETLATAGLLLVVFGCSRSGLKEAGAPAVGIWLAAAILATPSRSYANPAIVLAALVVTGPMAVLRPTALAYVAAESMGALISFGLVSALYPPTSRSALKR
jgi:glycerol uptake facilitator-like aquaporin